MIFNTFHDENPFLISCIFICLHAELQEFFLLNMDYSSFLINSLTAATRHLLRTQYRHV